MPSLNSYVRVTGISGGLAVDDDYARLLRPRYAGQIETITSWQTEQIDISCGCWNVLSLPGIPKDPWPESVFDPCSGVIWLDYNLSRWDALGQYMAYFSFCSPGIFGNCLLGDGLRLYHSGASCASCFNFEHVDATGDQLISLPRGSDPVGDYSLIGNPFAYSRPWSSCLVTDGNSVISLPDAVSEGWIYQVKYWTGSSWQTVTDLSTGNMLSGKAYEIYPKMGGLAVIVPRQL